MLSWVMQSKLCSLFVLLYSSVLLQVVKISMKSANHKFKIVELMLTTQYTVQQCTTAKQTTDGYLVGHQWW